MIRWQWHQLDYMQTTCTSLQTDNHASTSPLSFYRLDALPCYPANSVKVLKAQKQWLVHIVNEIKIANGKMPQHIHNPSRHHHRHRSLSCLLQEMHQSLMDCYWTYQETCYDSTTNNIVIFLITSKVTAIIPSAHQEHTHLTTHTTPHHTPQSFYSPFSGTTRVNRCQKRTSGLYGARED